MTTRRLRITLLSKALVAAAYRRKCELIAAHPQVDLTVFVPTRWGDAPLEPGHTQGYVLRELPIRLSGNFHLHYYPTLRPALALSKPDIFHVDEEPYNLATFLAFAALRRAQRAKAGPRPKVIFFSWQNLLRAYPPPFAWMERIVLRQADGAIVGNQEAAQVWRSKGFGQPIAVIPQFGVDENVFTPLAQAQQAQSEHPFTVGYAGRLVSEKRIDLLIRALPELPEARLLVVGNGPQAPALRALAEQLGVAGRVEFRAGVPSSQMPEVYQAMDALALPSETRPNWKEQFGRVLIEAMACGVPVLGADSGEIPHVIDQAGLIFPEGDGLALIKQLRDLQAQPRLRAELAQRGRARVLQHFTMRRIAEASLAFYQQIAQLD